MAGSTVDILARLKLNGQNFTSELQRELGAAERKFGQTGNVIGRNISQGIGGGLQQAASRVPVLGGALSGLSGPALIAAGGVGAITAALTMGISEAETLQRSIRQLDATISAGGNRTGFNRQQLIDFSEEIESSLAIAQEEVLKTISVLATFEGVSGTTFKRVIETAADMSATFGGDLAGNSEKLGVVLQNLANGDVEGLRKGFKFLGTDTIDTVEKMAKMGRESEAVELLLGNLEKRIGSAAEANAKGVSGAFFRLKDSVGDAGRVFVEQTGIYSAFVDLLNEAAEGADRLANKLKDMGKIEGLNHLLMLLTPGLAPMASGAPASGGGQGSIAGSVRGRFIGEVDPAAVRRRAASGSGGDTDPSKPRTNEQAFRDFERILAAMGVRPASGRYGFRTTADQREISRSGESPLDGVRRVSRHQTWQAFDPARATADDAKAREAARQAGLKDFKIVNESGGRKHYEWKGHGRAGDLEIALDEQDRADEERRRNADQAAQKRKQDDEERRRKQEQILATMREQLNADVDALRYADLRARGLERQAALEEELDAIRKRGAEQLAGLPEAEARVSAEVEALLGHYEQQAQAMAKLIQANGARATLTKEEVAAEEAAHQAMIDALADAVSLAATGEDRLRIEEAIVRAKHAINNAVEDGTKAEEKARDAEAERLKLAEKWLEEEARNRKEAFDAQQDRIQDLADFYERAFRSGGKSIWEDFEDEGLRVLSMMAAQWTMALLSGQKASFGSLLQQIGATSNGGGLLSMFGGGGGGTIGSAAGAAPGGGIGGGLGSLIPGIGDMPGGGSGSGGMGGLPGGLGSAVPMIGAAMAATSMLSKALGIKNHAGGIFGIGGNLLISALTPAKRGSATLGLEGGELTVGSTRGNSSKRVGAASDALGQGIDMLNRIAEALGGTIGGRPSGSLGMRGDSWRFDPTGRGITKTKNGALDFGQDVEAAVRAFVVDGLKDGLVSGISETARRVLANTKDLDKAIEKAALIVDIPRRLAAQLDPVGAAMEEFHKGWEKQIAALKEGGATAEEMAAAQKLYRLELEEVKSSAREASAGLKDFLNSLNFGSSSPYSLRDQERMARESLQPFLDKIAGGERIDQEKFQAAARGFLDIERELYGSTGRFFESMDLIHAATGKAIADIDNAKPIRTFADPFVEKTAANTAAIANINDQMNTRLADLGTTLETKLDAILRALGGGGSFVGSGRGFASRSAVA